MSVTKITRDHKPTVFPCWLWIAGSGATAWGYWEYCLTHGHYLFEMAGECSWPEYWHPDQPDEPERPYT